jgi:cation diffusion facilitator CzcD-associated flavoprotein CzcO
MTQPLRESSEREPADELDVLIVGAGFSGLYQLHHLRRAGFKLKVYEAAPSLVRLPQVHRMERIMVLSTSRVPTMHPIVAAKKCHRPDRGAASAGARSET